MDAAEQARLRRERFQAKIKAEGSVRLQKIQRLPVNSEDNGKIETLKTEPTPSSVTEGTSAAPADSEFATAVPTETAQSTSFSKIEVHPDSGDLSEHYYEPNSTSRQRAGSKRATGNEKQSEHSIPATREELRQLLMMEFPTTTATTSITNENEIAQAEIEDPVLTFLHQMGLGGPLGDEMEFDFGEQQELQQEERSDKWGPLWKGIHIICALILTSFTLRNLGFEGWKGNEVDRYLTEAQRSSTDLFYYFATMEFVLQSSRYLIEKGRPPAKSILVLFGSYLPHPFRILFLTAARYSVIWTTITRDALVIIFLLGLAAWWNSRSIPA